MTNNPETPRKLTPELLLYLAILLMAGVLRFLLLGRLPLDDHEASLALQALQLSRGEATLLTGEPGYTALTSALFFVTTATEFAARFWPALAGTLLVMTPFLFRDRLGKLTALILAGLLAIDPILIGVSRSAEGSSLALLGTMAALGFGIHRRPLLCGLSLGLALAGGPGLWPGVLVLVVLLLINRKGIGHIDGRFLMLGAASAGITLLLLSTILLTAPSGISAFGSSITGYLSSWITANSAPLPGVSTVWVLSLFPMFLFAIWGLVTGVKRSDKRVKWLGIWAGAVLALVLLNPARHLFDLVWVSIPVLTLAAIKLEDLVGDVNVENPIVFLAEAGLVVALVIFSAMNAVNLVNNPLLDQQEYRNRVFGTILPLILLLGMTVLLVWGWSGAATRQGLLAGVILLGTFFLLCNSWKAAALGSRPEFEIRRSAGSPIGRSELLSSIKQISISRTGIANRIDIAAAALDIPSLAWVLRDFEQAQFVSVLDPVATPSIVLTGVDQEISLSASYRGQKVLWQLSPDLKQMKFRDWMKWLFFRHAPVEKKELILWARNDLFPGGTTP